MVVRMGGAVQRHHCETQVHAKYEVIIVEASDASICYIDNGAVMGAQWMRGQQLR